MFTMDPREFGWFDPGRAREFVEFWSQFQNSRTKVYGTQDRIDYFAELNVGGNLTEENVRRLLRWKDPAHLTHRVLWGPNRGRDNTNVVRVLRNLAAINSFRNNRITEDDMRNTAEQVFRDGIVFKVFLLHIAKPHSYPIADQHVFKAFSLHNHQRAEDNWETYAAYRKYFGRIAQAIGVTREIENIRALKRIDDALVEFGKFLKKYYRENP